MYKVRVRFARIFKRNSLQFSEEFNFYFFVSTVQTSPPRKEPKNSYLSLCTLFLQLLVTLAQPAGLFLADRCPGLGTAPSTRLSRNFGIYRRHSESSALWWQNSVTKALLHEHRRNYGYIVCACVSVYEKGTVRVCGEVIRSYRSGLDLEDINFERGWQACGRP